MPDNKEIQKTPKRKQLYYTNAEARVMLIDILQTHKIKYLSLNVQTSYIEVIQPGEHESAGAIASLITAPGIFGFDKDPENIDNAPEVSVVYDTDYFKVVTRTIIRFSREHAKPMFADDGINDDDEGIHESPDDKAADEDEDDDVVEDISKYTKAEVDEELEDHDTDLDYS